MNNRTTSLEFICWSVFLGGVLFFLDIWLSDMYEDHHKIKQLPPDTKGFEHTREEKAIL